MTASLIIPCWNCAATLNRSIACVLSQTFEDFEAIFIDDGSTDNTLDILSAAGKKDSRIKIIRQENRGVSAARNAGLDVARGEFIFFADPDDTFSRDMISKGVMTIKRDNADYCVFPYREKLEGEEDFHLVSLKGDCQYTSNADIVSKYMSRMFGYSVEHVRNWYAGASLYSHRVQGSTCACVYRRQIIEKNNVRFDERIKLYEDAMFNCEYMLYAKRMTSINEPLYNYIHLHSGAISRLRHSVAELENKFELLRKRKELDKKRGGTLWSMYSCSCVFSLLEMIKILLTRGVPFRRGLRLIRAYAHDEAVVVALREFPLTIRHPLIAMAILFLRIII